MVSMIEICVLVMQEVALHMLMHKLFVDRYRLGHCISTTAAQVCNVCCVLSTVHCVLYTMYCIPCSAYCILCMQVIVLQTLADERCLHLMPPLTAAVLPSRLYATNSTDSGRPMQQHQPQAQKQLQSVLRQLAHGDLLGKARASNSLVVHLKP